MKSSFRTTVGRRVVVAALAALLPLSLAAPVKATFSDTLDQPKPPFPVFPSTYQDSVPYMAQTFTAGMSGYVDRVSLPVWTPGGFAMWTVSVNTVDSNGLPTTAPPLGTAPMVVGPAQCCQYSDFALTPNAQVTSGNQYAIVVQVAAGNLRWLDGGVQDRYPGGRQYIGASAVTWQTTRHGDFGFQEWIANSVNQAPAVSVDKGVISYAEGSSMTATNSGTCSDPDGDTVTLTATAGTVSACTAGHWSWNMGTPDELPQEPVTITASDGSLTKDAKFTVAVNPAEPTASILSDPPTITVAEGSTVPFTGAGHSPDSVDNAAGFSYGWTVTSGGATYATGGNSSSFSFVPEEPGSYLLTFTVTDDGLQSGSTSMTVIATSIPPAAKITSWPNALVITSNETLSFAGGYTDSDQDDRYTTTWNFGDNSPVAAGTAATHSYSQAGTYTVTFHVDDGEGGGSTATATLTVQTTQQSLSAIKAYVQGLSLNAGQKNSLSTKLDNAAAAVARGDNNAASNELNAFLNELQAYVSSGKVGADQGAALRTAVNTVRGSLGTFNRLVEWWPLEA